MFLALTLAMQMVCHGHGDVYHFYYTFCINAG